MKIFYTLPLNDNTQGFRFHVFNQKGLYRKRSLKKRWGVSSGDTMRGFHFGKRSVYFELPWKKCQRPLSDFALKWYEKMGRKLSSIRAA